MKLNKRRENKNKQIKEMHKNKIKLN